MFSALTWIMNSSRCIKSSQCMSVQAVFEFSAVIVMNMNHFEAANVLFGEIEKPTM